MLDTEGVTETELSYIAGFLDGEGSLVVGKYPKGGRELSYRSFMTVVNTYLPIVEWIQSRVGGKVMVQDPTGKNPYSKLTCYVLTFSPGEIRRVIPRLLPYLIVKKKQAEVLLAFLERQASNASAPVSVELLEFYEQCYQRLKELKRLRFEYIRPAYQTEMRRCQQCGEQFPWSSQSPQKIYCSFRCKKKTHWMRSNRRIALNLPAWGGLLSTKENEG